MSDSDKWFIGGFIFGVVVAGGVLGWLSKAGRDDLRADAIEHGAARWAIDAKTGERRFEWIGGKSDE